MIFKGDGDLIIGFTEEPERTLWSLGTNKSETFYKHPFYMILQNGSK